MKNDNVLFYSEAKLKDGCVHHAIAVYNRVSGNVSYLSDNFITQSKISQKGA